MRRLEEMSDFEVMIEKERTRIFKQILEIGQHGMDSVEISVSDLYWICANKQNKVGNKNV